MGWFKAGEGKINLVGVINFNKIFIFSSKLQSEI